MIMCKPAEWSDEIAAEFERRVGPRMSEGETVESANYYTPMPPVDEYNRGSHYYGFTYVINPGRHVCYVRWTQGEK